MPKNVTPLNALAALITSLTAVASPPLAAQAPAGPDSRRAYATRSELEETLAEAELVIASPGYSERLRNMKSQEAESIRQRLREGDFQVGDQIALVVLGEANLTDTFTVGPGRVLTLPGMEDIQLAGILRYEAEAHLAEHLKRFLRDPQVEVVPMIRMSVLGRVGRPGFYQFPANMVIADAIMRAGGPAGGADPNHSRVRRSGTVIVSEEEFPSSLEQGLTLDQLSLRAGDELVVGQSTGGFSFRSVMIVLGSASSLIYLINRVF